MTGDPAIYKALLRQSDATLIALAKEKGVAAPVDAEGKLLVSKEEMAAALNGECTGCKQQVERIFRTGATKEEVPCKSCGDEK